MSAIRYPVAPNAEQALAQPAGRAARESEAKAVAQGEVEFATQAVGPAFASRAEALAAFTGRLDDGSGAVAAEDRYLTLREIVDAPARRPARLRQAKATLKDGRRWSEPPPAPATAWRLSISFWRIKGAREVAALEQARRARRRRDADHLDAAALRAMAHQPLAAVQPQQPLDIGLFEYRPPEAPHLVIPDE